EDILWFVGRSQKSSSEGPPLPFVALQALPWASGCKSLSALECDIGSAWVNLLDLHRVRALHGLALV
ncbi:unnamed protein product, partial [Trichogramma brassicae]